MSNNVDFFKNLKPLDSFVKATDINQHHDIPQDWYVIVADVVNSTVAIENGAYKKVNMVGAATIISILNIDKSISVPYCFGGDGASLAIPPEMLVQSKEALSGMKHLANEQFGLQLRVGIVPVVDLEKENAILRVAKLERTGLAFQSILSGRGWDLAEDWIKAPHSKYVLPSNSDKPVDLSGLECRWEAIPSFRDSKICILIKSLASDASEQVATYKNIYKQINDIYGPESIHHPIKQSALRLSLNPRILINESKAKGQQSKWKILASLARNLIENIIGRVIFKLGINTKKVMWSEYQKDLISNTDYKKFDGMFKVVLDGSSSQHKKMEDYLDELWKGRTVSYGVHQSNFAILTCFIYNHHKDHAHFVDGSDGGYAIASKSLKFQLKILNAEKTTKNIAA